MPLVRIDLLKGKGPSYAKQLGGIVYQTMHDVIGVPSNDNFQIVTEHDANSLIYDHSYLGIDRSNAIVIVQITLNEGRTTDAKRVFFAELARRLNVALGVRPEDVFVNLVEVTKENWSFGQGLAQYAK